MRRLSVFNLISMDGYFVDQNGDMSWAHKNDPEFKEFAEKNASGNSEMLFGRITYQLMASYWPTPMAAQNDPVIANRMNSSKKVVFSKTLKEASWNNTRVVSGDLLAEVRAMKEAAGDPMVMMGSGSVVAQLAAAGLIDEYQMVVTPVVLGAGRTMFEGMTKRIPMRLTKTRAFSNGNVFLTYEV